MHLAAKTTLQLTWVLPVKRLNIIRSRYSTATILRTQNPFPHATLPSPSPYHSPLVSSRSSPAPRSELSPLSRDVPFALTARVRVGRSTRLVSAKRTRARHCNGHKRHGPRDARKRTQAAEHRGPRQAMARRTLRAHGTSAGRQKHAPGEREAHTLAGFQDK